MVSESKADEIIDLTGPEVIELDSDGEVIPGAQPSAKGGVNGEQVQQPSQPKRKRKKRKRKPAGASTEEGEIVTSSAEASRPHSRNSPDVDDLELHITVVPGEDDTEAKESSGKLPLEDRLTEPVTNRDDTQEGKRERRGKDRKRDRNKEKDDDRERDRDKDRDRDKGRNRERRRRSRSRERERERERGRDHDRERDGERDGERSRRRSRSRERDRRKRYTASDPSASLFFEDTTPADIPTIDKPQESVAGPSSSVPRSGPSNGGTTTKTAENGLLLPAHVLIVEGDDADASELKVPTPEGSDDEDYIDYLDYDDDRKAGMVRYWELEKLAAADAKASKPTRTVCKNCGAEGEHKTYECPVLICLTCGARDEHSTRSCPISKTCFTCGMKGHINRTCPNRAASRAGAYSHYQDCDRCGSRAHQTNECPTLWRIYEYVDDDERQEILRVRESKRTLPLGQGGEGYIATDEWCYNCGGHGHLGDDCNDRPKVYDIPNEPSAFSLYNILSGPFSSEVSRPSKRAPRDWETASTFADGFGFVAPLEVGKRGRQKENARLGQQHREREEGEEDDWFDSVRARGRSGGGSGNGGGRGGIGKDSRRDRGGGSSKPNSTGKIRFDFSQHSSTDKSVRDRGERDSKRQRVSYADLPGPSRETDSIRVRGASKKQDRHESYGSSDRYDRERSSRGPRYRGGYSR
ncbi:hypothetical protein C8Q79DRAFT_945317 [Trametes meyenii]|nr:hypothetical protein C8Q79DRAFT_945317 [Trametes meyenii]